MSTLNVSNITDGTTTVGTGYVVNGSAKAWVNFNGTGTIAARDSLNLSSLTDNGTGQYNVNLSSAMANSVYSYTTATSATFAGTSTMIALIGDTGFARTASSYRIFTLSGGGTTFTDSPFVETNLNGDLA